MSDWTAGYVADIGYTYGYYPELNPLRTKLAFLHAGFSAPEFNTACELGYGQGLSINLHAAASDTQWHGTDFNPAQAGFAQGLARAADSGAKLYDDAFADFAERPDLPDFDYIGLHGIWSWISDANRAVIVDFIKKKLKVGGVLYISYNTQPGWASFAPMRHLMTEHVEVIGAEGHGIVSRINGALDFTEKLLATSPACARANPLIVERIKKIKEQNRHYLAHEYFNRDWHPMHFSTMADWLAPAKLGYVCSAHYLDHIPGLNLSAEQRSFLEGLPDAMFRESVRDFMVNQQFRRDYWIKGANKLNFLEQGEALRRLKIILVSHREDVSLKIMGAQGEAVMSESLYSPILDLLADHKPRTLGEIEAYVKDRGVVFAQLLEATMVLSGGGHLAAVQDDVVIAEARSHTDKINANLINRARGCSDVNHLASPVTGGGHGVNRIQQLFLLALTQGKKNCAEWAHFVWQILSAQGEGLLKEGKLLETDEENLAELTAQAQIFAARQLPILKALQIA